MNAVLGFISIRPTSRRDTIDAIEFESPIARHVLGHLESARLIFPFWLFSFVILFLRGRDDARARARHTR